MKVTMMFRLTLLGMGLFAVLFVPSHTQAEPDQNRYELSAELRGFLDIRNADAFGGSSYKISHDDEVFLAIYGESRITSLLIGDNELARMRRESSSVNPRGQFYSKSTLIETVQMAVDEACGTARDPSTQDWLYQYTIEINPKLEEAVRQCQANEGAAEEYLNGVCYTKPVDMKIPFCLKVETNVPIRIGKHERLDELIHQYTYARTNSQKNEHFANFYKLNETQIERLIADLDASEPAEICKQETNLFHRVNSCMPLILEPGATYIFPEVSETKWFQVRPIHPDEEIVFEHYFAQISETLRHQLKTRRVSSFRFAADIQDIYAEEINACRASNFANVKYQFEEEINWHRFSHEVDIARNVDGNDHGLQPARVGLIDSGVVSANPLMRNSDLVIPHEFFGVAGSTTGTPNFGYDIRIGNNQRHRTWPIDSDERLSGLRPSDNEQHHGSQVANLILGGSLFRAKMQEEFLHVDGRFRDLQVPIKLRMVNIAPTLSVRGSRQIASTLTNAIDRLGFRDDVGVEIFNLSVEHKVPDIGFQVGTFFRNRLDISQLADPFFTDSGALKQKLKANKGHLYVIAAGNGDGNTFVDLDEADLTETIYPAALGAEFKNLIVVAALNNDKRLTPLSNRGAGAVSIGAPGCAVPSIDSTGKSVSESGTSFAAPLVTFSAALIAYLRSDENFDSSAIKRRLIYSSDIEPLLNGDVVLGASLNTFKAVSVRSDVLSTILANGVQPIESTFIGNKPENSELVEAIRWSCTNSNYQNAKRYFATRSSDGEFFNVEAFVPTKGAVGVKRRSGCRMPTSALTSVPFSYSEVLDGDGYRDGLTGLINLSDVQSFDLLPREACLSELISEAEAESLKCRSDN